MEMQWPQFFPNNCPPNEAQPAVGEFYRIVLDRLGRSLKRRHFSSHKESQSGRTWPPGISECDLCAISLTQSVDDAKELAQILVNRIPAHSQKAGRLAVGRLRPDDGMIQHAPDFANGIKSHHNWWCFSEVDPLARFEYCDVVVDRQ